MDIWNNIFALTVPGTQNTPQLQGVSQSQPGLLGFLNLLLNTISQGPEPQKLDLAAPELKDLTAKIAEAIKAAPQEQAALQQILQKLDPETDQDLITLITALLPNAGQRPEIKPALFSDLSAPAVTHAQEQPEAVIAHAPEAIAKNLTEITVPTEKSPVIKNIKTLPAQTAVDPVLNVIRPEAALQLKEIVEKLVTALVTAQQPVAEQATAPAIESLVEQPVTEQSVSQQGQKPAETPIIQEATALPVAAPIHDHVADTILEKIEDVLQGIPVTHDEQKTPSISAPIIAAKPAPKKTPLDHLVAVLTTALPADASEPAVVNQAPVTNKESAAEETAAENIPGSVTTETVTPQKGPFVKASETAPEKILEKISEKAPEKTLETLKIKIAALPLYRGSIDKTVLEDLKQHIVSFLKEQGFKPEEIEKQLVSIAKFIEQKTAPQPVNEQPPAPVAAAPDVKTATTTAAAAPTVTVKPTTEIETIAVETLAAPETAPISTDQPEDPVKPVTQPAEIETAPAVTAENTAEPKKDDKKEIKAETDPRKDIEKIIAKIIEKIDLPEKAAVLSVLETLAKKSPEPAAAVLAAAPAVQAETEAETPEAALPVKPEKHSNVKAQLLSFQEDNSHETDLAAPTVKQADVLTKAPAEQQDQPRISLQQIQQTAAQNAAPAVQNVAPEPKAPQPAPAAHPALINIMNGDVADFDSQDFSQNSFTAQRAEELTGLGSRTALSNDMAGQNFANYVAAARNVSHPQMTQMVAMQMKHFAAAKADIFTIQLVPADLGRMDVRMKFDKDGGMKAHMTVEKPETLALLQRDQVQLQRILQDAGIDVDENSLSFDLRQENQNLFEQRDQNSGYKPQTSDGGLFETDNVLQAKIAVQTYGYMSKTGVNIMV